MLVDGRLRIGPGRAIKPEGRCKKMDRGVRYFRYKYGRYFRYLLTY